MNNNEAIIVELLNRVIKLEEDNRALKERIDEVLKGDVRGSKKYRGLTEALQEKNGESAVYSFREISKFVEGGLPQSAYKHVAFWANSETHSIALSWIAAGYVVDKIDMKKQKVTFKVGKHRRNKARYELKRENR